MLYKYLKKLLKPIYSCYFQFKSEWLWKRYIWGDRSRPINKNKVNVYYFKKSFSDNVGDFISPIIVDFVKKKLGIKDDLKLLNTVRLFAIGSVIHAAKSNMVVWGSGIHDEETKVPSYKFDIRAVRGPISRKILLDQGIQCPEIYGDPAVLLPLFYSPITADIKQDFVIVPHYSKEYLIDNFYKDHILSTLTSDWTHFVDTLCNSKLVISGSLHGIILAEAYGIPAILFNAIDKDLLKYRDYYHSTNRFDIKIANSITEALELGGMPAVKNLKQLQENLLKSFPIDIFNHKS